MPYIGTQPLTGQFKKLDAITVVNGQAAYTLNYNSAAYKPATANALLVSVNGVIQAAGDAYTISGSTITFTENLVTGDVIDFIIALGDTGSAVTPVDGSVTTAKLANDAVTSDKLAHDLTIQTSLSVPTIKDSSGSNTAMTIDSSGRVIQNQRLYVFADISQTSGTDLYISHSAGDPIKFGNVISGTASLLNTSTYKFQAPVAGLYMLQVALHSNTGPFQTAFHQNDTKLAINYNTDSESQHTSFTFNCAAGDECHIEADAGDNYFNGTGVNRYTWATWAKIV